MRLYLDTCFLNRPFDDQSNDRVRLETEALRLVFGHSDTGNWAIVGSSVLDLEISRTQDIARRDALQELISVAVTERIELNPEAERLAAEIQKRGIAGFDALHLACAVYAQVDVFLSTDDRLVSRAARLRDLIKIQVDLPLHWLETVRLRGN
jgi:predicted nucleic acid-binding protein